MCSVFSAHYATGRWRSANIDHITLYWNMIRVDYRIRIFISIGEMVLNLYSVT